MLYEDRARAESFGAVARLYDRARPSYPASLIDALLIDGARVVLDVGCGTGIAGTLLAARGCAVTGVEVDPMMAAVARSKGLHVEIAPFESWEDRGRRFDLVVSGQAWHWIDPHVGPRKAADLLPAGGRIGLFWNFDYPPAHVLERLVPIYERLAPDLEGHWDATANDKTRVEATETAIANSGRFSDVEVLRFPWSKTYETREFVQELSTHSDHRMLTQDHRDALLAAVAREIDALGGVVEVPYVCALVTATRA